MDHFRLARPVDVCRFATTEDAQLKEAITVRMRIFRLLAQVVKFTDKTSLKGGYISEIEPRRGYLEIGAVLPNSTDPTCIQDK